MWRLRQLKSQFFFLGKGKDVSKNLEKARWLVFTWRQSFAECNLKERPVEATEWLCNTYKHNWPYPSLAAMFLNGVRHWLR